jgi:hypothetical protein
MYVAHFFVKSLSIYLSYMSYCVGGDICHSLVAQSQVGYGQGHTCLAWGQHVGIVANR